MRSQASEQFVEDGLRTSFPRRIEHRRARILWLDGFDRTLDTARDESAGVGLDPVQAQARPAVLHGGAILLDGNDTIASPRKRYREQPGAGIQIDHGRAWRHSVEHEPG